MSFNAQQDYINILGQNFTILSLIILCLVTALITIGSLIVIIAIVIFRNTNQKNSEWKKFKIEKAIYETEEQIIKMILSIEKSKNQGGE